MCGSSGPFLRVHVQLIRTLSPIVLPTRHHPRPSSNRSVSQFLSLPVSPSFSLPKPLAADHATDCSFQCSCAVQLFSCLKAPLPRFLSLPNHSRLIRSPTVHFSIHGKSVPFSSFLFPTTRGSSGH